MPRWPGRGLHLVCGHRMPPMALLVLAALARRHGWDVRLVDENYDPLDDRRRWPDAVGITVWTMLAPHAYELADRYRARGIPVVLGGVHASLMPGEALRHADAVVAGEAEGILPVVLDDLAAARSKRLYHGPWLDMDAVPRLEEWADLLFSWPRVRYVPANTLQTTRGCRFNCDFCSVIRINGRGSRHRHPEAVVEELGVLSRHGQRAGPFTYTFLLDDDLAADLAYTEQLCEEILRSGLSLTWGAQASIGLASCPRLVQLAARAGCRVLFTGFESVSRQSLIECNKKNRPSHYAEAVERLHGQGIMVEGGFIFGFDHDDPGVFDETAQFADAIEVDSAHFAILTPYPGTCTFARMAAEERILHYDWSLYDLYHAVYTPLHMTSRQLEEGLHRAYRQFYSSKRRWRRLRRHLAGHFHPAATLGLARANRDYARRYRHLGQSRPGYAAPPEEVERLVKTSMAAAQDAIPVALQQAQD
jgi:radical SAM superfamily enzyme YgiQ (UPF0313 family)